ncbi:MAG: signal peptidase I [Bdellovibrionales bacterium]|nr:signal peptidase I [Bdellovibrionales bacterium]
MRWGRRHREDKRGRWSDVFASLACIVIAYMFLRWISFEPFVIPSGSMRPNLLVQDYVFVKKFAYGLRLPFTKKWLFGPSGIQRGDVVVFKGKGDDFHFLVKRVIGLPGDSVVVHDDGKLQVNGEDYSYVGPEASQDEGDMSQFVESHDNLSYTVQYEKDVYGMDYSIQVPEGEIFLMGDNRNRSMDSRYWGTLPEERVLGKAWLIWMSCEDSEKLSSMFCPPEAIRWPRLFQWIR